MNWIVQIGKDLVLALTDTYRPELHYMRGPGPKWQAKNRTQYRTQYRTQNRTRYPAG